MSSQTELDLVIVNRDVRVMIHLLSEVSDTIQETYALQEIIENEHPRNPFPTQRPTLDSVELTSDLILV
jgi:hypothetical protein